MQLIDEAYQNGNFGENIGGLWNNISGVTQKMRWEENLRATQYQTAVEDMQKAGLNPAMMYQSGGNSGAGVPSAPNGSTFKTGIPEIIGTTANLINSVTNARRVDEMTRQNEITKKDANGLYKMALFFAKNFIK